MEIINEIETEMRIENIIVKKRFMKIEFKIKMRMVVMKVERN